MAPGENNTITPVTAAVKIPVGMYLRIAGLRQRRERGTEIVGISPCNHVNIYVYARG